MNQPSSPDNRQSIFSHDTPLRRVIFQRIEENLVPRIRFDEFMDLALYHNQHGYYAAPIGRKIGRDGDFFTSVSVGETFGLLLSYALEKAWRGWIDEGVVGSGSAIAIVEQGAHDGQLARDILNALVQRESALLEHLEYLIIEPRASVREQLDLSDYSDWLSTVDSVATAHRDCGMFLCNELLDAFPVRRLVSLSGDWQEMWVEVGPEASELRTVLRPVEDADLDDVLKILPNAGDLPEGYTTELCSKLKPWVSDIAGLFEQVGSWWLFDYGMLEADYFHPSRADGHLQCYWQHQAVKDPLSAPGEIDLTAHVNYSHLFQEVAAAGLQPDPIQDQSRFLIENGRDWLLQLEGQASDPQTAARLRQFQSLTHPSLMGQRFQVAQFQLPCD